MWILILAIYSGSGVAVTSAEFSSQSACLNVAKNAEKAFGGFSIEVKAQCYPKY